MDNRNFDNDSISTYKLSDLHGKTLEIFVGKDGEHTTVCGRDKNGHVYVITSKEDV